MPSNHDITVRIVFNYMSGGYKIAISLKSLSYTVTSIHNWMYIILY